MTDRSADWPRRGWLAYQTRAVSALVIGMRSHRAFRYGARLKDRTPCSRTGAETHVERIDLTPWQTLAQQAVDAARAAGARYADAHLSRIVKHKYGVGVVIETQSSALKTDEERIGVSVRALVDGFWGFSASAAPEPDEVVRIARDAVAQAKANGRDARWTVDLGQIPIAKGSWETPVRIDPFTISIEEKKDYIRYWHDCAKEGHVALYLDGQPSWIQFVRQERVVATSEGSLFTQILWESGGEIICHVPGGNWSIESRARSNVQGIDRAGAGWELFLDAKIPEQFLGGRLSHELTSQVNIPSRPASVGRYTLVCDGAAMAAIVESTLGTATQLDRALGYEANARGTSFIDDPLAMVGQLQVAPAGVTVTANRSMPGELATVKWDEEGVVPEDCTLIKDGVLVDFQTTREQAAWLAPYYQRVGRPVRSHGYAAAESAHVTPIQHMPNLSLEPNPTAIQLDDLVREVPDGIMIEGGEILNLDSQARTGVFTPDSMRQIKNGKLGSRLTDAVVQFDSKDLFKNLKTLGGASTQARVARSTFVDPDMFFIPGGKLPTFMFKGQPRQESSHSVRGVAALILNQPIINPSRRG